MRVWITGGSSEIGMAIAKSRLEAGDEVVITASSPSSLERTLRKYGEAGLKVEGLVFSLESPDEAALRKELAKGIDALVLNAATRNLKWEKFGDWEAEEIRDYVGKNVNGNLTLLRLALQPMLKKKFGRVVLISSLSAAQGTSRSPLYCLSKSALEGLFLNLAVDYGADNVFFSILRPGIIATERTKRFWKRSHYVDKMSKIIPSGSLGKPAQIAEAIAPLLSKDSYMNGSVVTVSGGLPLMRSEGLLDV